MKCEIDGIVFGPCRTVAIEAGAQQACARNGKLKPRKQIQGNAENIQNSKIIGCLLEVLEHQKDGYDSCG